MRRAWVPGGEPAHPDMPPSGCSKLRVVTVPFFSGADVERAVSPHEAYDAVTAAFIAHAEAPWTMQPKVYVSGSEHGDFRAMPALGDGHARFEMGYKFSGEPSQGPSHGDRARAALRHARRVSSSR